MKTSERAASGSLAAVLPRLSHHMEMINRTINGGYPTKLGMPLVDALEHDLSRFQGAIDNCSSATTAHALEDILKELDAPLKQLQQYFGSPSTSALSHDQLQHLVDTLYNRIRKLKAIEPAINAGATAHHNVDAIHCPVGVEKLIA